MLGRGGNGFRWLMKRRAADRFVWLAGDDAVTRSVEPLHGLRAGIALSGTLPQPQRLDLLMS